ncbi:SRPBCC family protein [Streptomyces sp. SCSIO ZS0520]|uniref:SRPBCC family protein n=1 Tax=Streptomyces sp. SCSIO ZS0520 TaxID=2892996 RepID=UPI0021DA78A5|nr:SRPBCC family protein [Streptomyces sp. SCSIO ZS0520]
MAENALGRLKDDVVGNPATDRLKQELQNYLQARAEHAVSNLGSKLGDAAAKFGESGSGPLAKGSKALSEGKSPAKAALTAGASQLKDTVKDKIKGAFGKGGKSGGGKSKSVTIVEDIDVGVPVREAYDQWSQFQEFSTFAKGVVSVERADDTTSNWKVKVAKSTRSWRANVTEQVPDERITWTTEGAKGTVKGVVTFHALTEDLTRVLLVLEYFPKGLFEKTGNIWRAQGRRARLDLKLFRKFLMMRGEATDGWRGEIRDGEVVLSHEDAVEEEEARAAEEEGEEGTGAEDSGAEEEYEEDEPVQDQDEELAAEDEPLDEDEDEAAYADEEEGAEEDPADDDPAYEDELAYEDEEAEPEDAEDVEDPEDEDSAAAEEKSSRRTASAAR